MLSRLERSVFNTADPNPSTFLTIHELPHILDESVDNSERLSCSTSDLVLRQTVKPVQDRLDILLLEKFLHKSDCALLSKVKRRREQTHSIVAA